MLQDLLAKELDALLLPADEGKRAALEAAKAGLQPRLASVLAKVTATSPEGVVEGVCELLRALWKGLSQNPQLSSIHTAMLESSAWLDALTAVFRAACDAARERSGELTSGGAAVAAALDGIWLANGESALSDEQTTQLLAFVEWWGDEVCARRLGITDAWGFFRASWSKSRVSPMHAIAGAGLAAFLPLGISKGCPVDGDLDGNSYESPAGIAAENGRFALVEALIERGQSLVQPYGDGRPIALLLFEYGKGRVDFLSELLRKRPEIITASTKWPRGEGLLEAALTSADPDLVDVVLTAGAPIEYRCRDSKDPTIPRGEERLGTDESDEQCVCPSIFTGLETGDPRIIGLLISKGKVFDNWRDKYDERALRAISIAVALLAISAYPTNPHFEGSNRDLIKYDPQAMECLELVLATGFVCPVSPGIANPLLSYLYPPAVAVRGGRSCRLKEEHALALLRRLHAAGFDVLHFNTPMEDGYCLHDAASRTGHTTILQFCLEELGVSPEHQNPMGLSLLHHALLYKNLQFATLLLDKYKVRVAYPERSLEQQPVVALLSEVRQYRDAEAQKLLGALIEREPSLFSLPCFAQEAVSRMEAEMPGQRVIWNPIFALLRAAKMATLQFLLSKNLPGVAAMANRPMVFPYEDNDERGTPAQWAAIYHEWDSLSLLLRLTDARVSDSQPLGLSAHDLVRTQAGASGGPPRALVAMVEARAKKELAERAKAKERTGAATSANTNAFEDPSIKPLTEKEEKAKAKKRAAKKKAKAKKRASATANAGAGNSPPPAEPNAIDDDETSSEDDDDEEPFEEPDDNLVDSRYAPSLDLMLEQMGLKTVQS